MKFNLTEDQIPLYSSYIANFLFKQFTISTFNLQYVGWLIYQVLKRIIKEKLLVNELEIYYDPKEKRILFIEPSGFSLIDPTLFEELEISKINLNDLIMTKKHTCENTVSLESNESEIYEI